MKRNLGAVLLVLLGLLSPVFSGAQASALEGEAAFGVAASLIAQNQVVAQQVMNQPGTQSAPLGFDLIFGPLVPGHYGTAISARLIAWSLPWSLAGLIGLWASSSGDANSKGFWGMNAAWGLVNIGIAYAGWLGPEPEAAGLRQLLFINAGLDVAYILGGALMMLREDWRGAGWAVMVQGGFLLVFDVLHALMLPD